MPQAWSYGSNVLDELLGLNIVHAMHTGDTITKDLWSASVVVVDIRDDLLG